MGNYVNSNINNNAVSVTHMHTHAHTRMHTHTHIAFFILSPLQMVVFKPIQALIPFASELVSDFQPVAWDLVERAEMSRGHRKDRFLR